MEINKLLYHKLMVFPCIKINLLSIAWNLDFENYKNNNDFEMYQCNLCKTCMTRFELNLVT